jgi:hypothetical protein
MIEPNQATMFNNNAKIKASNRKYTIEKNVSTYVLATI